MPDKLPLSKPLTYYLAWIDKRKEQTKKEIPIPPDPDGSPKTRIGTKDYLCHNGFFKWKDYTKIRLLKLKILY